MVEYTEVQAALMLNSIKSILGEKVILNFMSLFPKKDLLNNSGFQYSLKELHEVARYACDQSRETESIKFKTGD
jgi:hypothetical protein